MRKYFKVLASPDSSFAGPRGSDDESVCLVPAGEGPRQRHRHQRPAGGAGQQAGQQRLGYHFIWNTSDLILCLKQGAGTGHQLASHTAVGSLGSHECHIERIRHWADPCLLFPVRCKGFSLCSRLQSWLLSPRGLLRVLHYFCRDWKGLRISWWSDNFRLFCQIFSSSKYKFDSVYITNVTTVKCPCKIKLQNIKMRVISIKPKSK